MKYRDSGMPEEGVWDSFFNPEATLELLDVRKDIVDLIDIGTGYGTFLIPAANMISGIAVGVDIDELYLGACKKEVTKSKVNNVALIHGDISEHTTLEEISKLTSKVDYISLFNILHCEQPVALLKQASKLLTEGGKIGVIHWNHEVTPRGPAMEIRPKPEDIMKWGEEAELTFKKQVALLPYHYGVLLEK